MERKEKKVFSQLGRTVPKARLPGPGYSAFVRAMRLALPLAAIGIIGLVLSWPRVEKTLEPIPQEAESPKTAGRNELVKPHFESADEKSQPYTITADRAVQSASDPSVILLDAPMADITMNDGTWMSAKADNGSYRQDAERLMLQGKVRLFHDKGYELQTEKLLVNMKERRAWSDVPISGHGPAGTLEATGMQANAGTDRLIFTGPVKLVLNRAIEGIP